MVKSIIIHFENLIYCSIFILLVQHALIDYYFFFNNCCNYMMTRV